MRTKAPGLLPVFRSELQARLLAVLFGPEAVPLSIAALARKLDAPLPTVHREIQRLEASGLLTSLRAGRTRLVQVSPDFPYAEELGALVTKAFGVPSILREELSGLARVDFAGIFGSWAARAGGHEGPVPGDIDLLVVGHPEVQGLYEAVRRVEDRIGLPIDVVLMSPQEWIKERSGFLQAVAGGPLVAVIGELP